MEGTLLCIDGTIEPYTPETLQGQLDSSSHFWLDIIDPGGDVGPILTDTFHFHPLAVEDALEFGQRPKLDDYDNFVFLSMHGADEDTDDTVEVHCFYGPAGVVTVRRAGCSAIDDVRRRMAARIHEGQHENGLMLLYRIADALVDSFFPVLSALDDRIDQLEDAILLRPTSDQLGELFEMKQHLVSLRKVVTPERDMFAAFAIDVPSLPHMDREVERHFRDVYDHLIRISDLVDSYRDLLSGALDTHLSVTSNRLNQVMKQLTVIATVFMPLTFLTGFFGQNFAWMVTRITSRAAFWGVGVGSELAALVVLYVVMRQRRWL
jgi:magnesium transporter